MARGVDRYASCALVWSARRTCGDGTNPEPAPDGVVLRVDWCGICGTDVEEYLSGPHWVPMQPNALTGGTVPLTLGHEFAGQVVTVGPAVRSLRVGDLVAVDTLVYCGKCYWCLRHQVNLCEHLAVLGLMGDGGLADYCAVSESACIALPDTLRTDEAALAETLAVGVHALRRGRLLAGETVAVVGAGAIGLCALQAALHSGARRVLVVEPNEVRRTLAEQLGAALVVDPGQDRWLEQVRAATAGRGPDLVLECGGRAASVAAAIAVVRSGGRVVLIGTPRKPVSLDFATLAVLEKN